MNLELNFAAKALKMLFTGNLLVTEQEFVQNNNST